MAENKPEVKNKKPKRKLKATPTFREHSEKQDAKLQNPKKHPVKKAVSTVVYKPLRFIGCSFIKIGIAIGKSPVGRLVASIYKSRVFTPVRFIVKILSKILFIQYFYNAFQELKLVTWPTNKVTWRLTGAVLAFGIIFGLAIAGLDFVLEKVFREVILG